MRLMKGVVPHEPQPKLWPRGKATTAPATSRGGALKLVGLSKTYGTAVAVEDLSLDVASGEFVTLLGPSGSGKTTTLGMIAGFIEPDKGDVYLDGTRVTKAPPYRRGLGVVFQNYALFPLLSVFENLAFPLRVRRQPAEEIRRRVARSLELVGLTGFEDRMPRQLSGGQQQRVALARALVYDPPVLLMDEPLGALDKKLRERLQVEIKQIQSRLGVTVIYVTHDQEEALVMSDRIVVMNRGRIEQVGTPAELYHRSANEFVADFIGQSNLLSGTVVSTRQRQCKVRVNDALEVIVEAEEQWEPGTCGVIVVRPENISVGVAAADAENRFFGVVDVVAFVGDSTKYTVRLEGGMSVCARVQRSTVSFAAGDRVTVAWSALGGRIISRTSRQSD
jgi:spermidine/putrescine ABC transporter ATP-binding subunit